MNTTALYDISQESARAEFPLYMNEEPQPIPRKIRMEIERERLMKRYGIAFAALVVWGISMILGCCITGVVVRNKTLAGMEDEYARRLDAHQEEQAQARAAEYFLSGDASREAAINQAVDAVAKVIAKLSTDAQKSTEASCILARVMSSLYPNSFEEVCNQPQQWMFYDPDANNTFTQRDREIAESVVRPYMESGIVPNGLTDKMVYGSWSTNDFVLRDSYENKAGMTTWRWQG